MIFFMRFESEKAVFFSIVKFYHKSSAMAIQQ